VANDELTNYDDIINMSELWYRSSHVSGKKGTDPFPVFTGADNTFIARPYLPVDGYQDKFYPSSKLKVIPNIITFSMSTHTERTQVRVIGEHNPRGTTVGGNTVAGTIICHYTIVPGLAEVHPIFSDGFNSFLNVDETMNMSFYQKFKHVLEVGGNFIMNNASPFDLIIKANNESGYESTSIIYGMTIQSMGETRNINDMTIEQTFQYLANGAIASLPSKMVDEIAVSPGKTWAKFLRRMEYEENRYGLISIGKRRF
jgi:hypothetical protein